MIVECFSFKRSKTGTEEPFKRKPKGVIGYGICGSEFQNIIFFLHVNYYFIYTINNHT
jgi:hypothetical protein